VLGKEAARVIDTHRIYRAQQVFAIRGVDNAMSEQKKSKPGVTARTHNMK